MPSHSIQTVKSCGNAHPWCNVCKPAKAAEVAARKVKLPKVHTKPCRNCGRCDACMGLAAPEGMKICRDCQEVRPLSAFARRNDTGGYRNQCMRCRNGGMGAGHCEACGRTFTRHSDERTLCAKCRPPLTKACGQCGVQFVGSMDQRSYCSKQCAQEANRENQAAARRRQRAEALRAYGGERPACSCCGEMEPIFLALDHVNGGGHKQRKELGGGGFLIWLRKNNYPEGFRILCHNCNFGREINGGVCPHQAPASD